MNANAVFSKLFFPLASAQACNDTSYSPLTGCLAMSSGQMGTLFVSADGSLLHADGSVYWKSSPTWFARDVAVGTGENVLYSYSGKLLKLCCGKCFGFTFITHCILLDIELHISILYENKSSIFIILDCSLCSIQRLGDLTIQLYMDFLWIHKDQWSILFDRFVHRLITYYITSL